ncbi:MAG TPA: DUF3159 domain-containing protein [Actinocatenispora sp.]
MPTDERAGSVPADDTRLGPSVDAALEDSAVELLTGGSADAAKRPDTDAAKPAGTDDGAGTRPDTGDEAAEQSFSEMVADQLGGVRGVVESCIPILVFIGVNIAVSLRPALLAAVGVAVAIGVFRLVRRQPVRHAVNGLFGIALGGIFAWKTGQAKDFYVPGIFIAFGYALALVVSMVARRPLIGYVWGIVMTRGKHVWRESPLLMRTFQWLTLLWAACFVLRGAVQGALYVADQATLLGVSRIALSWPLYVVQLAVTLWAVRRAGRRVEAA